MDIEKKLVEKIRFALKGIGFEEEVNIVLEVPRDTEKGDYATNIAMILASKLGRNPMDIANDIAKNFEADIDIATVEVAKPGFINISLSNRYFLSEVSKIVGRGEEYFEMDQRQGDKVLVEYTDANPFKELHIGHLYSNAVGESFSRLQEALGADVERACYQGDIGLHVAKTMWGLDRKLKKEKNSFESVKSLDLEDRVKYLGDAYVLGAKHYDEIKDAEAIKEIKAINKYLFSLVVGEESDDVVSIDKGDIEDWYSQGRQWCLDFFEKIYEKVGTKFDHYFFESEVGERGLQVVMDNVGSVFEEDDGAVIYRGDEKKNLHTRVFVNSEGVPTYEAKEIGLAFEKAEVVDFDESVVITADEQSGYFKVVLDALGRIDPELSGSMKHFSHGKVKLPGSKKMSSRKGGILAGEWLIDETKRLVLEKMQETSSVKANLRDSVAEKIAIAAIKYTFLKVGVGRDIVFDFDKSISFDGDTGPYLMYVYSRCNSILQSAKFKKLSPVCFESCLGNPYTKGLVRAISRYKKTLLDSASSYSPSILAQYLFDLGQTFNAFYQNVNVLSAPEEERHVLLSVVNSTMIVMKDGLDKLGIEVVEKM